MERAPLLDATVLARTVFPSENHAQTTTLASHVLFENGVYAARTQKPDLQHQASQIGSFSAETIIGHLEFGVEGNSSLSAAVQAVDSSYSAFVD